MTGNSTTTSSKSIRTVAGPTLEALPASPKGGATIDIRPAILATWNTARSFLLPTCLNNPGVLGWSKQAHPLASYCGLVLPPSLLHRVCNHHSRALRQRNRVLCRCLIAQKGRRHRFSTFLVLFQYLLRRTKAIVPERKISLKPRTCIVRFAFMASFYCVLV